MRRFFKKPSVKLAQLMYNDCLIANPIGKPIDQTTSHTYNGLTMTFPTSKIMCQTIPERSIHIFYLLIQLSKHPAATALSCEWLYREPSSQQKKNSRCVDRYIFEDFKNDTWGYPRTHSQVAIVVTCGAREPGFIASSFQIFFFSLCIRWLVIN